MSKCNCAPAEQMIEVEIVCRGFVPKSIVEGGIKLPKGPMLRVYGKDEIDKFDFLGKTVRVPAYDSNGKVNGG
jgi:hypothetical protein